MKLFSNNLLIMNNLKFFNYFKLTIIIKKFILKQMKCKT